MASIENAGKNARTGKTMYRARWRTADGQSRSKNFSRRIDAERFLDAVGVDKARGTYVDPSLGKTTLDAWFATWRERQTHLRPSSELSLDSIWRNHLGPAFGAWPLAAIGYGDVADWVARLTRSGLSASRTRQAYHALTGVLDDAVRDGLIPRNQVRGVDLPKLPPSREVYLSHSELHTLANECGHYRLLVLVLGYTGMRVGEVRDANVRDFDPERNRVHVRNSKTGRSRWVPVPAFIADELTRATKTRGQDDALMPSAKGARISLHNWRRRANAFDDARLVIGKPNLHPHDLRHTAASLAIAAGANVKAVQQMLGHASAAMTLDRYGHLFDEQLDAVAVALDAAFKSTVSVSCQSGVSSA